MDETDTVKRWKSDTSPVSKKELMTFVDSALVPGFRQVLQTQASTIKSLQARVAELEQYPFRYDGPHESEKVYERGSFVTKAGSLWHANYKTATAPGDGLAWTLAAKRGRDGKDLRHDR